jgi:2-alkenal reductase
MGSGRSIPEAVSTQASDREMADPTPSGTPAPKATSTPAPPIVIAADDEERLLEEIYQRVNPSVVHIRVVSQAEASDFFELPDIPGFEEPEQPDEYFMQSQGSGFVFDEEGHIATNNHVVEGAEEIIVTFNDGLSARAQVIGADADADLAVLRVDLAGYQMRPVELADSDSLRVGQRVIAIGNPFGLQGTMTTGIISALARSLPTRIGEGGSYSIPDIIQTDAAINPGNSGGPLLDSQGRLIGVNTAIESPVRLSAGVGFAIPVNIVKKVVPALIREGHYEHSWIGITAMSLNLDLLEAMELPIERQGILIIEVTEGSPADEAGLQPSRDEVEIRGQEAAVGGDIIVAIDGEPMKRFEDLISFLARKTVVGQEIEITVLRDGKEEEVSLVLAGRPEEED